MSDNPLFERDLCVRNCVIVFPECGTPIAIEAPVQRVAQHVAALDLLRAGQSAPDEVVEDLQDFIGQILDALT